MVAALAKMLQKLAKMLQKLAFKAKGSGGGLGERGQIRPRLRGSGGKRGSGPNLPRRWVLGEGGRQNLPRTVALGGRRRAKSAGPGGPGGEAQAKICHGRGAGHNVFVNFGRVVLAKASLLQTTNLWTRVTRVQPTIGVKLCA